MSDAGRVIAGAARGTRLLAPGEGTRALTDRVKQTLFAILEPDLPGVRVLDLFAGSGAAGIEALSRSAAGAVFVERDRQAADVIRRNLERTRLAGPAVEVLAVDAMAWLRGAPTASFDLAILDPPYDRPDLARGALEILGGTDGPLRPGGQVVVKHFWRDVPPPSVGLLASERERRFGETALTFYRRRPAASEEAADG